MDAHTSCALVCECGDTCVHACLGSVCVYTPSESLATYDWHASANDMQMQAESQQVPPQLQPPPPRRVVQQVLEQPSPAGPGPAHCTSVLKGMGPLQGLWPQFSCSFNC